MLPVPPPYVRPSVRTYNDQRSEDDITHKLVDIIKTNNKVAINLMTEFAIRLRKSDQQIEALSLDDAEHRIGVSILNLADNLVTILSAILDSFLFI